MSKKQTTPTTIQLSVAELKEMGDQLTNIMNRLEMTNHAIEGLEQIQQRDQGVFNWLAMRFFDTTLEQNQKINNLLDKVAFHLLECDNATELQAFKTIKEG